MQGRLEHKLKNEQYNLKYVKKYPDYISGYYSSMVASSAEETTIRTYINYVCHFLDYLQEQGVDITKINNVTHSDAVNYMAKLRYVTRKGEIKQASHAYRAVVWSALNMFFNYCVDNNLMTTNPMKGITRDSGERDNVKRIALDKKEIDSILKAIDIGVGNNNAKNKQKAWKERDKCIILTLLLTGMRVTALTEINIEDINFEERVIHIIDKNEKTHIYPIPEQLYEAILLWLNKRSIFMSTGSEQTNALFISSRRKRMTDRTVREMVYKYSSVIGYRISPHKFRSTYGTNLYNATHDLYMVQTCMGHANAKTTTKYIKQTGDERVKAASIMSSLLK